MSGAGTGAGSAWAVPIKPPMSKAADEPATTAVARTKVLMVDMTLLNLGDKSSAQTIRLISK